MSGAMSDGRNEAFQKRLQRIQDARIEAEVSSLLDEDGNPFPDRTEISPLPDWRENVRGPATVGLAFAMGLLLVVIVRLMRFHLMGSPLLGQGSADLTMLMDISVAALIGIPTFMILKLNATAFKFAIVGGVVLMAGFMHNLVHAAPGMFNLAFSKEWTDEVIADTEPASFLFRGQSFVLVPEPEEEKVMPTIRRL